MTNVQSRARRFSDTWRKKLNLELTLQILPFPFTSSRTYPKLNQIKSNVIFPCLLTRGLYNSSKCTKWLAYEQRRKEVWNRWPSSCLTPETILESFWFHKNRRISGFVLTSLLLSTKILLFYFWNQNNDANILSGVDFCSCESHLTSIEARTDTDPWICSLCCSP